jgi:hypothetical protein
MQYFENPVWKYQPPIQILAAPEQRAKELGPISLVDLQK